MTAVVEGAYPIRVECFVEDQVGAIAPSRIEQLLVVVDQQSDRCAYSRDGTGDLCIGMGRCWP